MLDIDCGLDRSPDEDKYRYWDDDSLNMQGKFYTRLARNTVIYGDFNKAWKSLKGNVQYNNHRIRKNKFLQKQIKNWALYFMEKLGIDRNNFIARTDEYMQAVMDKFKQANTDSPNIVSMMEEIRHTFDMMGGDWLEMSKRNTTEAPEQTMFMPIQATLTATKKPVKQIAEDVSDAKTEDMEE